MNPPERNAEDRAAALERQARREQAYFRYALTGIVETSAAGTVVAANPAAASILGVLQKTLPGRPLGALLALDAAQRARFNRHLAMLREQGIHRSELEARRADGTAATLEWTSVDLGGGATLHSFDDISERKAALEATERARRAAEDAAEAKSRFAANVSHEIRTPLSAILGLTEVALRSRPPAPFDAQFARIKEAADLLLGLLNQVLDFSRAEAGRIALEQLPFALDALLERVRTVTAPAAESKGLELRIEVAGNVPRRLTGDPTRIAQVLLNLLGNAVKFTAQGLVRLHVEARASGVEGLRFRVTDTGQGLSREEAARLFEPFTQADASTTRLHGGTGLGLAISKRLVEAMGGSIELASEPGRGTTVSFELPLRAAPQEAPEAQAAARPPMHFAGRRILLAEDTALNREWLAALLRSAGAEVAEARDGQEAVAEATASPAPELILMDMQMPRLDGIGAARAIRAKASAVPIIALTANVTASDRERCLAAGMSDFLPKPFAVEALWAVLEKWLPAREPEAPLDPRALADRFLNDRALHRKFAQQLLAEHGRAPERIRAQCEAGALDEAFRLAHSLKGAAALVGADALAAAAAELERRLRAATPPEIASLCDALAARFAALQSWLGQDPPSGGSA